MKKTYLKDLNQTQRQRSVGKCTRDMIGESTIYIGNFETLSTWEKKIRSRERKKGRSRNSWRDKVTTGMREKGINNMEWLDREEWRRKIKLYAQKDVKTLILCT